MHKYAGKEYKEQAQHNAQVGIVLLLLGFCSCYLPMHVKFIHFDKTDTIWNYIGKRYKNMCLINAVEKVNVHL